VYCIECGHELPQQAQYCPGCGAETVLDYGNEKTDSGGNDVDEQTASTLDEIPEKRGRIDKKSPPKVSPLTIVFAILGLLFILVLLNPWHAGQERPEDFEGSVENTELRE